MGKYIAVYRLIDPDNFEVEDVIELPKVYESLQYGDNLGEIIASPFMSRQLQFITCEV